MTSRQHWSGVFAATLCAFHADETIDETGLRAYFARLSEVRGLAGIVPNGHTGEIMRLRPYERALVTKIAVEAVRGRMKVISGVCAEGSLEAIDHARAAREAGADAILLMPPHEWLRFGRSSTTAIGYFADVAEAGIPIIVHQYPAWTKASYSLAEMIEIARIPGVVAIKMGTRDMARWRRDYQMLKETAPKIPILTCHDEFLLPSLLDGADGCLVGFAGFAPELIISLTRAALGGDYVKAFTERETAEQLSRIIYGLGEPTGEAHQRMKAALWLLGKFPSPHMRRPLRPLPEAELDRIRVGLEAVGWLKRREASAV